MTRVTNPGYAAIPQRVLEARISDRALRLYAHMSLREDAGNGPMTRQTMAAVMGCTQVEALELLDELLDAGVLAEFGSRS